MPFAATWTDLESIIVSEVSEKEKYYMIIYMWNLKNNTNESIYKTETEWQAEKTNLPKGKGGGRDKLGVWD